jgi:hypothetical protein
MWTWRDEHSGMHGVCSNSLATDGQEPDLLLRYAQNATSISRLDSFRGQAAVILPA